MNTIVWFNGRFQEGGTVPVEPGAGLWRGEGWFETLAVRGRTVYNPGAHFERLNQSLPGGKPDSLRSLESDMDELVERFDGETARLKIVAWEEDGIQVAAWVRSYDPPSVDRYRDGIVLEVECSDRPPRWPLSSEKRTSYAGVMERRRRADGWGVCYCDSVGMIRECGIANVVWFDGDQLLVPPVGEEVLPGTVLGRAMTEAKKLGWTVEEREIHRGEPDSGLWVLNSLVGFLPVSRMGERSLAVNRPGPVWDSLRPALGSDTVIPLWHDETD